MPQPSGCCRCYINNRYWYCANYWRRPLEKSMDWLLKGGLYIVSYNKFYGYANIHDYVVGNFRIGCLLSYKVQESKGSLESASWLVIICITGYINKKRS